MTAATSREGEWCCMTYHLYSSAYIRRKQNRRGQRVESFANAKC